MIDPTNAASAAAGARLAQTTTPTTRVTATGGASFAGHLARFVSASSETVKAAARPDNEQTKKVSGHPYSRIENGDDKGLYLNQLKNSPRAGAVFKLVERDDRIFHVYGDGKEKVVVEVKKKDAAATTAPTGGTTPTTT